MAPVRFLYSNRLARTSATEPPTSSAHRRSPCVTEIAKTDERRGELHPAAMPVETAAQKSISRRADRPHYQLPEPARRPSLRPTKGRLP